MPPGLGHEHVIEPAKNLNAPPTMPQAAGIEQVLLEKDNTINQLRETVEILELKIKKME